MNSFFKNIGLWLMIGLSFLLGFMFFGESQPTAGNHVAFSEFMTDLERGNITGVVVRSNELLGIRLDKSVVQTLAPDYPNLISDLEKQQVTIQVEPTETRSLFLAILNSWLPILLIVGIWVFFVRQVQGNAGKALGFQKMKLPSTDGADKTVTFQDVAGIDEAKEELSEIVDFLADPKKFSELGGEIPRGALLIGNPGTGKTLMAKAIAGEAEVPFFNISGSDFVEMFVGVGASRVRDLFDQAKKSAPCIIFIDEIDALGRSRGSGMGGGHDEREQTLNQLLVEMDGFEVNEGIIVIAATNRPDVLDSALLRPGRFDRHITIPMPDIAGRQAILEAHVKHVTLAEDVDLHVIARGTPGFTGADLANLVNESALWAARQNKEEVNKDAFEYARDKVLMGTERKTALIHESEKRTTAYHEAGHAIVAVAIPEVDPVHKVTIIPRGQALGVTQLLPEEDRHSYTQKGLLGQIAMIMGGRAAEHLVFQRFTTGASDDLKKATDIAQRMVCQWGMSEKLGPLCCSDDESKQNYSQKSYSNHTSQIIDSEIKRILEQAYARAKDILTVHRNVLDEIADALMEQETIDGAVVESTFARHSS